LAIFGLDVNTIIDLILLKVAEPPTTCPNQFRLSSFNVLESIEAQKGGF